MGDIVKRLRVSIGNDAINGDSFERHVCEKQMSEAAKEIELLRSKVAEQQKLINDVKREIEISLERVCPVCSSIISLTKMQNTVNRLNELLGENNVQDT